MIRISSGLRAGMLWDSGLRSLMWRGTIFVYTGDPPSSADLAPTGSKIAQITQDAEPFQYGFAQGGLETEQNTLLSLRQRGDWVLKGLDNGTPGWWRFCWNGGDDEDFSLYYPRIDGLVGESLLNLPPIISTGTNIPNIRFTLYLLENV